MTLSLRLDSYRPIPTNRTLFVAAEMFLARIRFRLALHMFWLSHDNIGHSQTQLS